MILLLRLINSHTLKSEISVSAHIFYK